MISSILSFEFPPINELLRWRDVVPGLNKVGLIAIAAAVIGSLIFLLAARKDPKVAPKGTRNLAEVIVEFIPLGLTIIVAHLGLLFWEMRYVSLSLAYPGLKPKKQSKDKSTQQSESITR